MRHKLVSKRCFKSASNAEFSFSQILSRKVCSWSECNIQIVLSLCHAENKQEYNRCNPNNTVLIFCLFHVLNFLIVRNCFNWTAKLKWCKIEDNVNSHSD